MGKGRITIYGLKYFPSRGGTSRVVENLIQQLKHDYDITVYCYKHPQAATHILGIKVIQLSPILAGAPGAFLFYLFSALHILVNGKADVVHAHSTDCCFFLPLIKIRFKIIATSHEAPYKRDKWNLFIKAYFKLVEFIFIKSPNICTCVSLPLTEYYNQRYKAKVIFIPNGINITINNEYNLHRVTSYIPPQADINLPFILFSARRIMKTKGCHTMLEALSLLSYTGQIFIAGEENKSHYLQNLKKKYAHLNVHYLGFVHPLSTLLTLVHKCEFFIFPSETEGMSIMLLEVASTGTPIIASDIPENYQIFNIDEALYFKAKDSTDLLSKIKFATDNKKKMKQIGLKAQEKVISQYLWSNISESYSKLYAELLKIKEQIK